jgi:hypothetical protein
MTRWLALLAFLLFPSLAHAQTVTTKFSLNNTAWTDLGPGPLMLGINGIGVYAIGDAAPTVTREGLNIVSGEAGPVFSASHVWAMMKDAPSGIAFVAPIVPGGGGTATPTSVWSASDAAANSMTLSNGGLTVTATVVGVYQSIRGSVSHTSGKYYIEFITPNGSIGTNNDGCFGIADAGFIPTNYLGTSNYSAGVFTIAALLQAEQRLFAGSPGFTNNYGLSGTIPVANDVFAIAVDLTAGKFWMSLNNVWFGSGNPATGANSMIAIAAPAAGLAYFPTICLHGPGAGVWTLRPTAASQTYAPPAGFSPWDGAGGATGCSQATAYLARATGETAHAADLTTLICGLVTDGVWAKLDALYVLAQQTQADSLLNLVGTSYPLAVSGSLTFAAYQGFSGFVAGANILNLSGYNPGTNSLLYTQNNASLGVWAYLTVDDNVGQMGSGGGGSGIYASYGGSFYPRINVPGTPPCCVSPGTNGLFVGDRNNSASLEGYWNGIDKGTVAGTSGLPENVFFVGCGGSPSACTTKILSEAHIGASLGSAGNLALYNRLRTYMTSVGVP